MIVKMHSAKRKMPHNFLSIMKKLKTPSGSHPVKGLSCVDTSVGALEDCQAASDEPRLLEVVDEDLVDKLVLCQGLHHQHSLLSQMGQHLGYVYV